MNDHQITSIEQLEALYGLPAGAAVFKEIDHISAEYRAFIEAAPFFALATVGPEGVDCTPRGDEPGNDDLWMGPQDGQHTLAPALSHRGRG